MSLYFKERAEEKQFEDPPQNNMIKFRLPWIVSIEPIPDAPGTPQITCSLSFRTTYNVFSAKWKFVLTNNNFKVEPEDLITIREWNGRCHFSYKLYNELDFELYVSERISLIPRRNAFVTPTRSMKEFRKCLTKRKLANMIIFVELELPKLYFDRPFRIPGNCLSIKLCKDYPEDMDSDFRFEFLKESDFTFKCPDGTVPALKMVMNVTALKKYLNETSNDEFVVQHLTDVVKPIVTYFHSGCFEMPTTYNLDFADRLLKAINFFIPERGRQRTEIRQAIGISLSQKFVKDSHDFELILQWASLVSRHTFPVLSTMVSTIIAFKYYYQFLERFPENARSFQNGMFREAFFIFWEVETIYAYSLFTQTILD